MTGSLKRSVTNGSEILKREFDPYIERGKKIRLLIRVLYFSVKKSI